MTSLTFSQFHILTISDSDVMYHTAKYISAPKHSRCRPHLQLPLSQSARRPPALWALAGKRHQAGSGSRGPAGPDGDSSSVGTSLPSALPPSAAPQRTSAPVLSGSQRNHTATVLKSFSLEIFRFAVGLNGAHTIQCSMTILRS